MKTIKFVSNDRSQFTTTLRKNVNNYFKENQVSQKGNKGLAVKIFCMLSLYIIPFILIITLPLAGWMIFPLSVIMGIGMAGVGMSVMHDAAHGSSTSKKWLNKLLSNTIYLLGGSAFTWNLQHNVKHHTFTNINGYDEDIDTKAIIRLSKHAPLKRIHRFQYIYAFFFYTLMTIAKLWNDFKQLIDYNKSGLTEQQNAKPRKEFIKLILFKSFYVIVSLGLPLLFSGFGWGFVLLGFLTMHLTGGGIMAIIFQMAHIAQEADQPLLNSEGNIENEWAIHELLTTVNFSRNNRVLGWYIGGLNFQIEHHLFPNICHVHYRNISPIVERTAKEFGLRYNLKSGFFGAIASHTRMLKELGRQIA
ncbi:MAG: acyl-CoA desaturase [Bacteroidetes bacterium]|jgi:linoleoyl-CoA desaturase|nr:acyl-CoA desaturase [Bacteroidota bacterium]